MTVKATISSAVNAVSTILGGRSAEDDVLAKLETKLIDASKALDLAREAEAQAAYEVSISPNHENGAKADKARLLSKIASETKLAAEQSVNVARQKAAAVAKKQAEAKAAAADKEARRVARACFERADAAHIATEQAIADLAAKIDECLAAETDMRPYLKAVTGDDSEFYNGIKNAKSGIAACVRYATRNAGFAYDPLPIERFKLKYYLPSQNLFDSAARAKVS